MIWGYHYFWKHPTATRNKTSPYGPAAWTCDSRSHRSRWFSVHKRNIWFLPTNIFSFFGFEYHPYIGTVGHSGGLNLFGSNILRVWPQAGWSTTPKQKGPNIYPKWWYAGPKWSKKNVYFCHEFPAQTSIFNLNAQPVTHPWSWQWHCLTSTPAYIQLEDNSFILRQKESELRTDFTVLLVFLQQFVKVHHLPDPKVTGILHRSAMATWAPSSHASQ